MNAAALVYCEASGVPVGECAGCREESWRESCRQHRWSVARYEHHHHEWVECGARGDWRRAAAHLYALRAHLHSLGWLSAELCRPGFGVR